MIKLCHIAIVLYMHNFGAIKFYLTIYFEQVGILMNLLIHTESSICMFSVHVIYIYISSEYNIFKGKHLPILLDKQLNTSMHVFTAQVVYIMNLQKPRNPLSHITCMMPFTMSQDIGDWYTSYSNTCDTIRGDEIIPVGTVKVWNSITLYPP